MVTLAELRHAERTAQTAEKWLRELAFERNDDELIEIATSLIAVEAALREAESSFDEMSANIAAFDRYRDLDDLDQVLLSLRRFLALPDPGALRISGWSRRAAPQA